MDGFTNNAQGGQDENNSKDNAGSVEEKEVHLPFLSMESDGSVISCNNKLNTA